MRTLGIVLVVIGCLGIIMITVALIGIEHPKHVESAIRQMFFQIGLIGVGIYLIQRANNKKKEDKDREKWNRKQN